MTVTYAAEIATSQQFGRFYKLLIRWKGSVYKLLWKDFLLFAGAYYLISLIYRFALPEEHRRNFENLSLYCENYSSLIPLSFVLGFYVSLIVSRWWELMLAIPWPTRIAVFVTAGIHGHDNRGRLLRRTIMRYLNVGWILAISSLSPSLKKRFPTLDHLIEAGLLTAEEKEIYEKVDTDENKYFIPIVWATTVITRARTENRIRNDVIHNTLLSEVNAFRGGLGTCFLYDWMSLPLVYTQVVTIAVQSFFLACLFGRQYLDPKQNYAGHNNNFDLYVPVFTFLQFIFYTGWLKVAESLSNPFGEDDNDFETNTVIDSNIKISYLIVDGMHDDHPDLVKDVHWDTPNFELPYTAASEQFKSNSHKGSAADIVVQPKQAEFIKLASIHEGSESNYERESLLDRSGKESSHKGGTSLKLGSSSERDENRSSANFNSIPDLNDDATDVKIITSSGQKVVYSEMHELQTQQKDKTEDTNLDITSSGL